MARLIPNENTQVHFVVTIADAALNPSVTEVTGGVDLTDEIVTMDASTSGNTVPTPTFASLFETSISGTVTATLTAEFYRDDTTDTAWDALPRGTNGYLVVSRFGYTGGTPTSGDAVEVWPVRITSRSNMALTNNEVMRFGIEAAIPEVPNEDAALTA